MKKIILLVSMFAVLAYGHATNVVPVQSAVKASKNFLAERVGTLQAQNLELTLAYTEYNEEGTPVFYRFQVGDKGFIIVSATDLATPVLAYSLESNFKSGTGADLYCENYKKQISHLIDNPTEATNGGAAWAKYLSNDFKINTPKGAPAVEPLITTTWTQEQYYNAYCPTNPLCEIGEDTRTPVGCVALTMANILYYYRYPATGYGAIYYIPKEYDDETGELIYTYPYQYVNFSQASYNYDAMQNSLDNYNGELAKLIYHCGVSVQMGYGHDGSGSQSEHALTSLQSYFSYAQNAQFKRITDVVVADSLFYLWINQAKEELNAHRPLFFSGTSASAGGHAWIVDGYTTIENEGTSNTYFHVNWGWAGSDNGFYLINNQCSSGYGNFNVEGSEAMMIKLCPNDTDAIAKPATSETRVTASAGTISDGAGHVKYAPNSNRRWVLACPNAKTYTLKFSKLKVKAGDKVTIYNGGTEASGIRQEYSGDYLMAACSDYAYTSGCVHGDYEGQTLPSQITLTADSVLVVFTSAANSQCDYGFVLDYKVNTFQNNDKCSNINVVSNSWNGVLTDKANNANTDVPYVAGTSCAWQLRVPYTNGYGFRFNKFDLKAGDFVDVYTYNAQDKPLFSVRYDINNMPEGPFTVEGEKAYVKFVSDNWQEGNGFELEYFQIASINQHSDLQEVNIYPNPASSVLNVEITNEMSQPITAEIVDITGKVLYMEQFNHNGGTENYTLPVSNLAKGIYILNLKTQNGKRTSKFVVE